MPERAADLSERLAESHRIEYKDKAVRCDIEEENWSNIQFVRLVAINKRFTKVDFANSTFDSCYLRNCQFDTCNFAGVRFSSTNLHGATFTGCMFEYATFERTLIDDAILKDNCPVHENQKMRFARSLRTNYQQLGDADAANRAIRVELDATEIHLRKAWGSNDRYYRKKYRGFPSRVIQFLSWAKFKLLDYIWGNGESVLALLRAVLVLLLLIAAFDLATGPTALSAPNAIGALWRAPQIFFGVTHPNYFSDDWLTAITVLRLMAFAFFMSILIKRISRR
jgi:hypothetical protein